MLDESNNCNDDDSYFNGNMGTNNESSGWEALNARFEKNTTEEQR